MCYLVREQRAGAAEHGGATIPPGLDRVRSRWAGAVAAALIGGVALAALVAPSTTSTSSMPPQMRDSAPAVPVASKSVAVPGGAVVEQSSGLLDDGVPGTTDVAKAGLGHCQHGL